MASNEVLRVRAVPGVLAPVPGQVSVHGGQAEYCGRRTDHDAIKAHTRVREADGIRVLTNFEDCYPPDPEHNAIFSLATHDMSVVAAVRRLVREGDLVLNDDVAPTSFAPIASTARPARRAPNTDKPEDK